MSKTKTTQEPPHGSQDDYHRALTRFDAMPTKAKVTWVETFASQKALDAARCHVLRYELPALARSVGIGWSWREPKPLRLREVRRVHAAVREGLAALKASKDVRRATAAAIRQQAFRGGRTWTGWQLPKHRTHLRLLPQPAHGEQTSMLALFEAADEVSAVVAAFGYFLWRQAPSWRECACGCGLTFITNGKQRYIERHHQAAKWQKELRRKRRGRGAPQPVFFAGR